MNVQQHISLILALLLVRSSLPAAVPEGVPTVEPSPVSVRVEQNSHTVFPWKTQVHNRVPSVRPRLRQSIGNEQTTPGLTGQSSTMLPTGRLLLLGGGSGSSIIETAVLETPGAQAESILETHLLHARAFHTATVLPNGQVFITGGLGNDGKLVAQSEMFSPATGAFTPSSTDLQPRSHHTSTVLPDGMLLMIGGSDRTDTVLDSIEMWDYRTGNHKLFPSRLLQPRQSHVAVLQNDGTVRIHGGFSVGGNPASGDEVIDPSTGAVNAASSVSDVSSNETEQVTSTLPKDSAVNVATDQVLSLEFVKQVKVSSVNGKTISLSSTGNETVAATVVSAETGKLAFVTPSSALQPNTVYTLSLSGVETLDGILLTPFEFSFTTSEVPQATPADSAQPLPSSAQAGNQATTPEDPATVPLSAANGITALSGETRTVAGKYLPDVTFTLDCGGKTAASKSDSVGRFLILSPGSGHCVLEMDGTTAHLDGEDYGRFFPGVDLIAGKTNILPYTVWMTPIDHAHEITIPSPTMTELVVTNPRLKGLELHIPAGTVIRDYNGTAVTRLGMTRIPVRRPPFPLPLNVPVPIYFTIQPGGSFVEVGGSRYTNGKGAQLIYPNAHRAPAGTPFNFWDYDPEGRGWYTYGSGHVDKTRKSIVPDPGVVIHRFTGAMVATGDTAPPLGPNPGGCRCGDPVDPSTGLFTSSGTDLTIKDVISFSLTRTYRQGDYLSRSFGIGTSDNAELYLTGDFSTYQYADLIQADGSRIHFVRTNAGTDWASAIYLNNTLGTDYFGAQITWNTSPWGWNLRKRDGTLLFFPEAAGQTNPAKAAVTQITDRNGNQLNLTRDANSGVLTKVSTPNGRWITLNYDAQNRVIQALDNIGRKVSYTYDADGRLATVTDPIGNVTQYTYDLNDQMTSIIDPRGNALVTNTYDTQGHVLTQKHADGGLFQFGYSEDASGNITQTTLTDPLNHVETMTFSASGYFTGGQLLSDTAATGTAVAQTTTNVWDPVTRLLQSTTDALGRTTTYTYDALGNRTSVTKLAGTAQAVVTSAVYDPTFSQPTSMTDPLQHTTTLGYDGHGHLLAVTNAAQQTTNFAYNGAGQVVSATPPSPAGAVQFGYTGADLTSITDALGNVSKMSVDGAGRVVSRTRPLGQTTTYQLDANSQLNQVTDALGGNTAFSFDPNGNLLSLTDALSHSTIYTYDVRNQRKTRKDPLGNSESTSYDLNGNALTFTDRRGQVTSSTFDALDRPQQVTYADKSTISYSYDAGDRVTQVVDSISGTITRQYDLLDQLTQEQTTQGTVTYTYDAAGRRTSMTVSNQAAPAQYSYDNANRLTQIQQGTKSVTFAYDAAGRPASVTLPNGVVQSYTFDAAGELTGITYTNSSGVMGTLTYAYDANGNRTQVGGTMASTGLPTAIASAAYNANNQLTQWGGNAGFTYDLNGNMTGDGTNTYGWDARNQLASITGSVLVAPQYDAFGRRTSNPAGNTLLYDGDNIVQEQNGGSVNINLLTGLALDEHFVWSDSTGDHSYLTNALNSTVAMTDASGNVTAQYQYDSFGASVISGASSNSLQYTGRENDWTGLDYYRARYYSPNLQRFVSEDPIGFGPGQENLYGYAANAPTRFVDPRGTNAIAIGGWGAFVAASQFVPGWDALLDAGLLVGAAGLAGYAIYRGSFPSGYMDGVQGARQWGKNTGVGANEGKRRFHKLKQQCADSKGDDDYGVHPHTGDVVDQSGESVGNLEDVRAK